MKIVANTDGIVHVYDMFKVQLYDASEELVEEAFYDTLDGAREFIEAFPGLQSNIFKVEHFKRTTRI